MSNDELTILAIDLRKTSCRARATTRVDGRLKVIAEARGDGAPGVADEDGIAWSVSAIADTIASFDDDVLALLSGVGVGAAGVEAAPHEVHELVSRLTEIFQAPVTVVNDALAAHAGAFAGGAGTVLIAGTGAVVFDVAADGVVRQIDGWGPWLGDEGSGRWIGQQGLEAALRAVDGRGPATALAQDAAAVAGGTAALPMWVGRGGSPARRLGMFAPTVIARAEQGDAVAVSVVDRACRRLATSAKAAGTGSVCVVGGLTEHPFFSARLTTAMRSVGVDRVRPLGDALDGARLIAIDETITFGGHVTRSSRSPNLAEA